MIDRVVYLIDDEMNAALSSEGVERHSGALLGDRTAWIVRRVHEDQLGACVGESDDCVDVERETVFDAQFVTPRLDAERFGKLDERGEARRRYDDVRFRLVENREQDEQRFSAAVQDQNLLGIRAIHRRECGAQRLAAPGRAVGQSGVVERVELGFGHQRAKLRERPLRAGTHPQMVLDRIAILREPCLKRKRR